MTLLTWGLWVGWAWVAALVIAALAVCRRAGRPTLYSAAVGPPVSRTKRVLRAIGYGLGGLLLGLGSLHILGVAGEDSVRSASRANREQAHPYVDFSESLLVQLAACSPYDRSELFESLRLYTQDFAPMSESIVRERIATAAAYDCIGGRRLADQHRVSAPELGDCDGRLPIAERRVCAGRTASYDDLVVDGETHAAIGAARAAAARQGGSEQMWECLALGLEARESSDFTTLRAIGDPTCRLILASLLPLGERAALLDLSALDTNQHVLGLTLLAEASPRAAAAQLTRNDIEQLTVDAASHAVYRPGIANALASVNEAADSPAIVVLRVALQVAHGINAQVLIGIDEAEARFRVADETVASIGPSLIVERDRLQDLLLPSTMTDERLRADLIRRPRALRPEVDAQLTRVRELVRFSEILHNRLILRHALLQVLRGHHQEAAELAQQQHQQHPRLSVDFHDWLQAPHDLIGQESPALRQALRDQDGERIAVAMMNYFEGSREHLAGALAATTHREILADHLRYEASSPSCERLAEWRQLGKQRYYSLILQADDWTAALEPRWQELSAHLEDVLLHVPHELGRW